MFSKSIGSLKIAIKGLRLNVITIITFLWGNIG